MSYPVLSQSRERTVQKVLRTVDYLKSKGVPISAAAIEAHSRSSIPTITKILIALDIPHVPVKPKPRRKISEHWMASRKSIGGVIEMLRAKGLPVNASNVVSHSRISQRTATALLIELGIHETRKDYASDTKISGSDICISG